MKKYIGKRIMISLVTLLIIILVLFMLLQLMPGSPFNDEKLTADQIAMMSKKYGLDKPLIVQFFTYVKNLLQGDFGVSYVISKDTSISVLLKNRVPVSFGIGLEAVSFGAVVGLILGILAALKKNSWLDTICTVISVLGVSLPSYVFALVMAYFIGYKAQWLPLLFDGKRFFASSIMPMLALSMFTVATVARFTRTSLLEVLDSEQNVKFRDHYVEIPIDLSEVLFIATANTTQTIPGPLLDRMELIEVNSYTENEKYHIAKDYLIPKQLEKNGLSKEQLNITGSALEKMIHSYTREAGVRNLERRVGDICRKAAREVLEKKKPSIRVTERNLDHYLGREKVFFDAAGNEAQVGIVRGLAWTSVGGDTLQIEVNVMPGKGVLQMTGQMGDVMKESAQIALTYVRSVASDYGVKENYFEKHDIHLHIPEGAVPKDGPSAGITMATAMLSAVTGRKVLPRVAMTGEVTLRGHVLMIGGLKEKLLAARMAQVEKVLVPAKNQPDVEELSKEITKGMEIVYIKEMNEVIREAFVPEK